MKRIAIYIRSYGVSPSGYYRILQYTNMLNANFKLRNVLPPIYYRWYLRRSNSKVKIVLDIFTYLFMYLRIFAFFLLDSFYRCDIIIISRGLLPRFFLYPLKNILNRISQKSDVIWDFDDDILCSGEISKVEFDYLSAISANIIVTHDYLKSKVNKEYGCKITVLPTTDGDFLSDNHEELLRKKIPLLDQELHLVWLGSAVNLLYLARAIPALDSCALKFKKEYGKSIVLNICSSESLICDVSSLIIRNTKWNKYIAKDIVTSSHVGIMPLIPLEYSLGKGGFKLIQYMAAGLPVIASRIGYNETIVNEEFGTFIEKIDDLDDWFNAICKLGLNLSLYREMANNSLSEWQNKYSFSENLRVWASILNVPIKV